MINTLCAEVYRLEHENRQLRKKVSMLSQVEYFEGRIADLRKQQPISESAQQTLRDTIRELERCVAQAKRDAMIALRAAILEAR